MSNELKKLIKLNLINSFETSVFGILTRFHFVAPNELQVNWFQTLLNAFKGVQIPSKPTRLVVLVHPSTRLTSGCSPNGFCIQKTVWIQIHFGLNSDQTRSILNCSSNILNCSSNIELQLTSFRSKLLRQSKQNSFKSLFKLEWKLNSSEAR